MRAATLDSSGRTALIPGMSNLIRATPTAPTAGAPGATPPQPPPGRLDYTKPVTITDWGDLPITVDRPLRAVWSLAKVETRRRGGAYRQVASAWALAPGQLARVTQARPLEQRKDGKLAPAGKWRPETESVTLLSSLARLQRPDAGPGSAGSDGTVELGRQTNDVLDAIPGDVRRLLGDGIEVADAILRGSDLELVRALSVNGNKVVAVSLSRHREAGRAGPWQVDAWQGEISAEATAPARGRQVAGTGLRALLGGRR